MSFPGLTAEARDGVFPNAEALVVHRFTIKSPERSTALKEVSLTALDTTVSVRVTSNCSLNQACKKGH